MEFNALTFFETQEWLFVICSSPYNEPTISVTVPAKFRRIYQQQPQDDLRMVNAIVAPVSISDFEDILIEKGVFESMEAYIRLVPDTSKVFIYRLGYPEREAECA